MGRHLYPLKGFDYGYATKSGHISKNQYHYHESYELLYFIHGNCDIFIDDITYSVSDNYIVLIPPNILHQTLYRSSSIERYVLNFTEELIPQELRADIHSLYKSRLYIPRRGDALSSLMNEIISEYRIEDKYTGTMVHGLLNSILTHLLRNPSAPVPEKASISHPAVIKLVHHINEHFDEPLTINGEAERLGINRSYLSRIFNQCTGFTFKNYLSIIRIKEAKRLLEHTDKTVAEIAFECGFSDGNYFSTIFKKSEGISPIEHRKKYNKPKRGS